MFEFHWRAFEPLSRPQANSLLAWATWLTVINLLYVILVLYLDVASKAELRSRRTFGWIGIFLGIAFSGCNGAEFAALIAHPYWNSTLGPILSIAGDLLSGFALVLLPAACFQKELMGDDTQSLSLLSRTVLGLIILVLVLEWSEYSISAWYGVGQETALHTNVLFGSSWYLFWIGQLVLGSIIPAGLLLWQPASRAAAGDTRDYPGFKDVIVLRDADLSKNMAEDAKKVGKGDMSVQDFKAKYSQHPDALIDPDHPDLGPKNNQFVFMAGRIQPGRTELMQWFTSKAAGSVNAYEHTTICEQSHHRAYAMMTGGKTGHMKPDLINCEFVLFWGTGAYSANFGMTNMAEKVTSGKLERGMKTAKEV